MLQLGDFGELDFSATQGMVDKINAMLAAKDAYQGCARPRAVLDYLSGSYVNGKWDKTIDFEFDQTVKDYEKCGEEKTSMMRLLVLGADASKTLSEEDAIANLSKIENLNAFEKDVSDYKDYLQVKLQNLNNWTTPTFSSEYYKKYFGSWDNYSRVKNILLKEYQRRSKKEQAQSTLLQSTLKSTFGLNYLAFYNEVLPKYGSSFSQSEQQQLRKFFVEETPMQWTAEEFEAIGNLLKSRLPLPEVGNFATAIVGTVSTSTFEDAGGGMSNFLKRGQDFSNAMMRFMGSSMSYLPTPEAAQSMGLSTVVVAGIAGYRAWKALTNAK